MTIPMHTPSFLPREAFVMVSERSHDDRAQGATKGASWFLNAHDALKYRYLCPSHKPGDMLRYAPGMWATSPQSFYDSLGYRIEDQDQPSISIEAFRIRVHNYLNEPERSVSPIVVIRHLGSLGFYSNDKTLEDLQGIVLNYLKDSCCVEGAERATSALGLRVSWSEERALKVTQVRDLVLRGEFAVSVKNNLMKVEVNSAVMRSIRYLIDSGTSELFYINGHVWE